MGTGTRNQHMRVWDDGFMENRFARESLTPGRFISVAGVLEPGDWIYLADQ